MSVSLALIPVALAMRAIMGKENFNKWVESKQRRIETNITKKEDLRKYLIKAGYDANEWGSSIKTHIGKKDFFFWDLIDGKWVAIFSKSDSDAMIQKFIKKMESANNVNIFSSGLEKDIVKPIETLKYPTNFVDKKILIKTLKDYGINPTVNGEEINFELSGVNIRMFRSGSEPYTVEINDNQLSKDIYDEISLIDDDYVHNVVDSTYIKLKKEIDNRNDLFFENVQIKDDNSILVTVGIQET